MAEETYASHMVPPDLGRVIAIAAGGEHNLVLRHDGAVREWGGRDCQALEGPGGLDHVIAIAAGYGQRLALRDLTEPMLWLPLIDSP